MKNKFWLRFKKLSYTEQVCTLMSVLFVISLIPLIHIGFYSHPVGDDFSCGSLSHVAWETTGSVWAVLKAAFESAKSFYYGWQGTYSSTFILAASPYVFSERLYFLTPVIALCMLIGSNLLFFRTLFTYYLKLERSVWMTLCLSVLFLCIQILDTPGEAFFWYTGMIHYVFMHSCTIFFISCLLLLYKARKRWQTVLWMFLSCLFAFITEGGNYVTMLLTAVLGAFVLFFCLMIIKKNKRGLLLIPPLVVTIGGLIFNATAPGTAIRMADQVAPMSAPEAIYWSFIYAVRGIGSWTSLYVIFFVFLLIPILWKALYSVDYAFPLPGIAAGLSYCVFASTYTPSLYSMGHVVIFGRTLNIMQMTYYLLLILNLIYFIGWLTHKCKEVDTGTVLPELLSKLKRNCARSFSLFLALFFLGLLVFSDSDDVTSLSAADSLRKGYAQSYHQETLHRIALLSMEGVDEVWIPNYSVRPPLFDLEEISADDPTHWRNMTLANWYGKELVHLSIVY
ncbi:MAG: hypothetical protein HFJ10_02595 [Lachnospiraceae bacterium]|nr:hypothetical protein [Lachnospiraceae bacterium]